MLELTLRIGFSLLVVLCLMWIFGKAMRGRVRGNAKTLTVLARQQLTRGSAVAVVRVVDRTLVLGVTDQRVSLLAETGPRSRAELTGTPEPDDGRRPGSGSYLDGESFPTPDSAADDLGGLTDPAVLCDPAGAGYAITPEYTDPADLAGALGLRAPGDPLLPGQAARRAAAATGAGTGATTLIHRAPGRRWYPGRDRTRSPLAGSILSPQTWRDAVEFVRERTVRRS